MHTEPTQEWLRLTQEYRDKADEELRELHRDFADLTDVAQQALAAELRSRGLDKQIAGQQQVTTSQNSPWAKREPSPFAAIANEAMQGGQYGSILGNNTMEPVPDEQQTDSDEATEFSWKTTLCECEQQDQTYQISEVLRRAGIESWVQSRRYGLTYTRILVAADELDRAQAIIANPIPQDIIDESHQTVPEYEPPRCPSCGAEDPLLESAEPVNTWKCEICGREWADPAPDSQPEGPFS